MKDTEKKEATGRILLFTGDGKGKTTAALGIVLRASGQGLRSAVVSFIKSAASEAGEDRAVARLEDATIARCGEGFTWNSSDPEKDRAAEERHPWRRRHDSASCHRAAARAAWDLSRGHLADPAIDLVVMDEFTYPVKYGWITADEAIAAIASRPPGQHLVMTGRDAAPWMIESADTVTEMRPIKHAFAAGIPATRGIEW
jgi:cob(I)alamin adenosyltransferase